ncbi:Protein of unknown function (DUF2029) [Leptolyngbyaceae cyanobacterium JSC-12]|nr:Protein of unknown function (DUF2029) [Leptolyngbyaceae cyanobacterium JSC-12]
MPTMNNQLRHFWKDLSPLTRNLLIFALFDAIIFNLLVILFNLKFGDSGIFKSTPISELRGLITQRSYNDSWLPMSAAYEFVQSTADGSLYSEIFFNQGIKFQYPPSSLLVLHLLESEPLSQLLKALNISTEVVYKEICRIAIFATVFFSVKIFNFTEKKLEGNALSPTSKTDLVVRSIVLGWLALTFYPLYHSFKLGQIQTWLNALFAIVLWLWLKGDKRLAGGLTGIMCLIKPQSLLLLLWGMLRKQWLFVVSYLAVVFIGFGISILLFGFSNHLEYLKVLSFISRHGESFFPNQSFNGLLNRVLFNGNNLFWEGNSFPDFNPVVYYGATLFSFALVGLALVRPKRLDERGSVVDLAIIALTSTIASPVAWEHHYGILIPIYAYLLAKFSEFKSANRTLILGLAVSYLLTGKYIPFVNLLAFAPFNLNIIQSHIFFGGLIALVLLYILRDSRSDFVANKSK